MLPLFKLDSARIIGALLLLTRWSPTILGDIALIMYGKSYTYQEGTEGTLVYLNVYATVSKVICMDAWRCS